MLNIDFEKCTGCSACQQICLQQSIKMITNDFGFIYPQVSENCIDCKRCETVCPINKTNKNDIESIAYAVVNKNKSSILKASSGGAFDALANYVIQQNGVVYGCALDSSLKAKHIRVEYADELDILYGSKYIQSDINNAFMKVKDDLMKNRVVLFSGTPCQIAGLKSFLGRNFDNLILVDIICHGVPSQAYFDKYIKWLEKKKKCIITDYNFRSKSNHGWSLAGEYTILNKKNKKLNKKLFYFDNFYYYYFLQSTIYRNSCYSCKYANSNREADFTIGDFWGAEKFNFEFDTSNGCSLLLINTKKAKEIVDKLELEKSIIDLEYAKKYNAQLTVPSTYSMEWDVRMNDFVNLSAEKIQKKFVFENYRTIILARLKYLLPSKLKRIINKIRYKL